MAVNYLGSIPKLIGRENYDDWAFAVENVLVLEGLTKCITGDETDETTIAKAKAKLVLTIDASLYIHVKEAKTAKELWDKLKSLYDDSGFSRKIGLLRSLISIRLESSDSMENYVNILIETAQKLRRTGFKIDDEWVGSLLLAGLPEKYGPMIMAIEHSGINVSTDAIKSKLMDMAVEGTTKNNAFASKMAPRPFSSSYKPRASSSSYEPKTSSNSYEPGYKNKTKRDISTVKCYKCKQFGHFKTNCKMNDKQSDVKPKVLNAFSAAFLNGKFNADEWYVDSGASVHLTAKDNWLENTHKENMGEVMVANKHIMSVKCIGEVKLSTMVGKETHDVVVKEVSYIPELTTNLLSVSQLIKNGNRVVFSASRCKIYNGQNTLIGVADLVKNVYRLNVLEARRVLMAPTADKVAGEVWHKRFGHLNYNDLRLMRNGAVDGLNYKGHFDNNSICEVCCEGKQPRLPFKHIGQRADSLLEVIHIDLCGPMEVRSIGGSKYMMLIEDDFSRMTFAYFLQSKDEALTKFMEFKNLVENQKDLKIKTVRSDNGGEFCSIDFETFLKKCGIAHQTTNPYTPQQNGLIERMNRTIIEKARCLLFEANLNKEFWGEAVNTAVYLRNRSVVKGLNGKTPYEAWMNKKPDVGHIKIFGSEAMTFIPKEKRTKLDRKSKKLLLMGFCENTKGYRLYDPEKKGL